MTCSLKNVFNFSGLNEITRVNSETTKRVSGFCPSSQIRVSNSRVYPVLKSDFMGQKLKPFSIDSASRRIKSTNHFIVKAQRSLCYSRAMRWWEKTLKPNMVEVKSAQQLVDILVNAGDKLVILCFYSPGCGGCRALHPKVCQLAEQNPNAIFVQASSEELQAMRYALKVHALPLFRFYRGSQGHLRSFGCTISTINKFKDALAKYGGTDVENYNFGPTKGLEERELLELASIGEIQLSSIKNGDDLTSQAMDLPNENSILNSFPN